MYANLRTLCSNLKVNRLYLHECHTVLEYSVFNDSEALRPYVHKQPVARAPEPAPRVQLDQHASPPGDEQPMDTEVAAEPTPSGSSNDAAQAPAPEQTPSAPVDSGAQVPISSVPAPTISVAADCDIQVPMAGARPDRAQAFYAATQLQRELARMTDRLAQPATRPEVIAGVVREELQLQLQPVINRLEQPVLDREVVADIVRNAIAHDRTYFAGVAQSEMSTATAVLEKSSIDRDVFIAAVREEIAKTITPLVNLPGLTKGMSDEADRLLRIHSKSMVERVLEAVNTTMDEMSDQILRTLGLINTSAEKRHTASMGHIDSMIAERVEPLMTTMFQRLTTKAESGDLLYHLRTSTDVLLTEITQLANNNESLSTYAAGSQQRELGSQQRELDSQQRHDQLRSYLEDHTRVAGENVLKFHASNNILHQGQQLVLTKLAAMEAELRALKAPTAPNADVAKLQSRINKLEGQLATAQNSQTTAIETMGRERAEHNELKRNYDQLQQKYRQDLVSLHHLRSAQADRESQNPNLVRTGQLFNTLGNLENAIHGLNRCNDTANVAFDNLQEISTALLIESGQPAAPTIEPATATEILVEGTVDQQYSEQLMDSEDIPGESNVLAHLLDDSSHMDEEQPRDLHSMGPFIDQDSL